MPHHKSAKKRVRQTETRTARNKIKTSMARSAEKKIRAFAAEGDKENATKTFVRIQGLFAKLAKHGIIKSNTAARKTSRLSKLVSSL